MIKSIELIIVIILLIFSFVAGVKYSDSIKNHASWILEEKEDEIELPDLSNENIQELGAPSTNEEIYNAPVEEDMSIEAEPSNTQNIDPINNEKVSEKDPLNL
jgi:hypothetical protein